ncbi:MAG: transposase [Planctomycetaceae bacterium]|nr:transposase [Planctomycetaceae bacterium]
MKRELKPCGGKDPSDLTNARCQILKHLIPSRIGLGRPVVFPRRDVFNSIFYVLRSGCHWPMVPKDSPLRKPSSRSSIAGD